ncbi:unnamed protein product [Protopolystoma xenopodis]|uniref:Uncharacterized protein n=1 Tax=Protopolystoma xenopodis TaxID=117903 RepID=A0A448XKG3_9PLAT|nr:unnamed protein product [Protopolystoma xenopodis]
MLGGDALATAINHLNAHPRNWIPVASDVGRRNGSFCESTAHGWPFLRPILTQIVHSRLQRLLPPHPSRLFNASLQEALLSLDRPDSIGPLPRHSCSSSHPVDVVPRSRPAKPGFSDCMKLQLLTASSFSHFGVCSSKKSRGSVDACRRDFCSKSPQRFIRNSQSLPSHRPLHKRQVAQLRKTLSFKVQTAFDQASVCSSSGCISHRPSASRSCAHISHSIRTAHFVRRSRVLTTTTCVSQNLF